MAVTHKTRRSTEHKASIHTQRPGGHWHAGKKRKRVCERERETERKGWRERKLEEEFKKVERARCME